jgi:hypothetical protein
MNNTKFYCFRQNNSGGSFVYDRNLAQKVIIEAETADEANDLAKNLGIYFDGCDRGWDCRCCGDRWNTVSDSSWYIIENIIDYMTNEKEPWVVHHLNGTVMSGGKHMGNMRYDHNDPSTYKY